MQRDEVSPAGVLLPYGLDRLPEPLRFCELPARTDDFQDKGPYFVPLRIALPYGAKLLRCRALEIWKLFGSHDAQVLYGYTV